MDHFPKSGTPTRASQALQMEFGVNAETSGVNAVEKEALTPELNRRNVRGKNSSEPEKIASFHRDSGTIAVSITSFLIAESADCMQISPIGSSARRPKSNRYSRVCREVPKRCSMSLQ
jgi:hypothetical protein